MLVNRLDSRSCIECGLPYDHVDFACHGGRTGNGPSYWSDRGLLCSVACSTVHSEHREKTGDPMREPAPDPFEKRRF